MNGQPKKTSPWVWVGLGCLGALVLAVGVVIALGTLGYQKAKQFGEEMKDPRARAARVQKILGASRLPEGYHAMMGMSVPFVMDMAILSDVEPDFDNRQGRREGLGQRGFLYIRTLSSGDADRQQLRDYFEGRSDDADVLRRNHIRLERRGEVLKRGALDMAEDMKLLYLAQRGDLEMSSSRAHGISTVMLLDCPGDTRQRFAIWFGPDPAAAGKGGASPESTATVDLTGTPADESAIRAFMDHFRVCGG